jgi:DNA-binding response OmpR family regulator
MRVIYVLAPGEERPETAADAELLAKPFSPDSLARKVRALLGR